MFIAIIFLGMYITVIAMCIVTLMFITKDDYL